MGDVVINAIHCHGVLNEVVCSNGEEVDFTRNLISHDCGRGDFNHHADFDVWIKGNIFLTQLIHGRLQNFFGSPDFTKAGNHGEHDA